MITLKVDLESTQNYGMSIYKGDDSNFYMFNDCGDLLYKPKKTYGVKLEEVWEFAIGTFKLNEDRIITQTQEYFEKYYVCDKAAYEESLKGNTETLFEDYLTTEDTGIEGEIQRVLVDLKSTSIYSSTYNLLLTTLERLISIRGKI